MKAIEDIGFKKIIKFIISAIWQYLYGFLIFPPLRKIFLNISGAQVGSDAVIMNVKFVNLHHKGLRGFKVGKKCFIGDETIIDLYDSVILEDEVTLAQRITVLSHLSVGYSDHPLHKFFPKKSVPVTFKSGCVIGAAAIILPGITVGHKSFVGAGSVVTKNVPDKTLVVGVPAKPIRKIN